MQGFRINMIAAAVLTTALLGGEAVAQTQYGTTVTLAPQLAEPWTMQLAQRRPSGHNVRYGTQQQPAATRVQHRPAAYAAQRRQATGIFSIFNQRQQKPPRTRGAQLSAAAAVRPAAAARPVRQVAPQFLPTIVPYDGKHKPGTVIVDTNQRYLFLVEPGGVARRYGVGVGRPGFQWAGAHKVTRKAEWPGWTPPPQMRKRQPDLPAHMEGGPANPLGARALYLGSTLYRIHGSNQPWTIGHAVSSGCIRMRNEDVIDLYGRVRVGTRVIVI